MHDILVEKIHQSKFVTWNSTINGKQVRFIEGRFEHLETLVREVIESNINTIINNSHLFGCDAYRDMIIDKIKQEWEL